jgi:predicted aldo/keto reductase-like oxidoreductase
MRYQYKWQDVAPEDVPAANQANLKAVIHRALDLGINHIETARGYGSSEMQLGPVLKELPRDEIIVQTKVCPMETGKEFRQTFDRSFEYLQLDYVDLLGLHGINTPELLNYCVREGGCLDEALKLKQEGKVRYIGFSTHGPTDIIVQAIETGLFDYVNLHWYWIFQDNWPAIEAAQRQDMGVFIISPSDKGGMLYQPPAKLVELCQPLSPMTFNNLFCLSHPQVHTLSIGAAQPTDFDEHLKTLTLLDRAHDILPPILDRLEQAAIETLGDDWYYHWQSGLPSHEEVPENINLQKILWLYNLTTAYDMVEYGKKRYNLIGNGGHWFPGQTPKDLSQVDLTDCLKHSPFKSEIPQILIKTKELLAGEEVQRLSQSD